MEGNIADSAVSVLRDLESQNPQIANTFRQFRRASEGTNRRVFIALQSGDSLETAQRRSKHRAAPRREQLMYSKLRLIGPLSVFGIGLGVISTLFGTALNEFIEDYWRQILFSVSGLLCGSSFIVLLSRIWENPLRKVTPPHLDGLNPLEELESLAKRTSDRLRVAYRMQLCAVILVGLLLVFLVLWTVVLVSRDEIAYATAFGSGSLAMVILAQWKWQPFDRINQARTQADRADVLATGLRLRMKAIEGIVDPVERSRAQGDVVREYIELS